MSIDSSTALRDKSVGFIGFGNQGRAQALNLRDSGVDPIFIGNRADSYVVQIEEDGFMPLGLGQVAAKSDVLFLLVPDEVMPAVYEQHIEGNIKPGATLVFASGYNITYKHISPASDLDVILVAPRMIGEAVRARKVAGQPVPCFIAVQQDATGEAEKVAQAVASGIGATQAVTFKVTFEQETFLDLLSEQAVYPIIVRTFIAAFEAAVQQGCPPEATLLELYGSEEPSEVMKQFAQRGIFGQLALHSRTSQYGQLTGFAQSETLGLEAFVSGILRDRIVSGAFDQEWLDAQQQGDPVAEQLTNTSLSSLLKAETTLREKLYKR